MGGQLAVILLISSSSKGFNKGGRGLDEKKRYLSTISKLVWNKLKKGRGHIVKYF